MSEQIIVAGHVSTGLTAPMLHLAGTLADQGHEVTAIAASRFADSIPSGVAFSALRGKADIDHRRLPELFPEFGSGASWDDRMELQRRAPVAASIGT